MRILVLQLARFGDIYQSIPTLNALKAKHVGCDLHVLVRTRFAEAMAGYPDVTVHCLPTAAILAPLWEDNEPAARRELARFLAPLVEMEFERIVNLSFSPVGSYLTDFLANATCTVSGYTRHSDGHLNIPDDASAYFYAQVGIDRANRFHVTELFAAVAGVELSDRDFGAGEDCAHPRAGIVVHLGASTVEKVYPPDLWVRMLRRLCEQFTGTVTLVGSQDERPMSETVHQQCTPVRACAARIENRVGQTKLPDLMSLLKQAQLLIGSDSAPVHMAALTGTPVLNLSSRHVNFWETGPLTPGSRIFYASDILSIDPDLIARNAMALLNGRPPEDPCLERIHWREPYRLHDLVIDDFSWQLIQALYLGQPFPAAGNTTDALAFTRIFELAELALTQLDRFTESRTQISASKILAQVDTLLPDVARLQPRVAPLVQWFETQRLRLPPASADETLRQTRALFRDLHTIAATYTEPAAPAQEIRKALALCRECIPELREFNLKAVQNSFSALVNVVIELARSTLIANLNWALVLGSLTDAMERGDYIAAADILEWKLEPAFAGALGAVTK
jgi:heptosyltransferase-3